MSMSLNAHVVEVDGAWRVVVAGRALPEHYRTLEAAQLAAIEEDAERETAARMAGMALGLAGYNDAMGYDTSPPIRCGHHCYHSGCSRCSD